MSDFLTPPTPVSKMPHPAGKATAQRLTLVSRLTFHESCERSENAAGGIFQHAARAYMLGIRLKLREKNGRNISSILLQTPF